MCRTMPVSLPTDLSYSGLFGVLCVCVCVCVLENKAIGVMKPGHSFTIEPMINQGVLPHIQQQLI